MDFDLDDEQSLLKDGILRLLRERCSFAQRQIYSQSPEGFSRALWRQYADMGLLGLPFPPAHGGFGGGPVEMMIVMEAFGRALILEPYLATVVLFGGAIDTAGSEAQKSALLPRIAAGELLGALAHAERDSRYDLADVRTRAHRAGSGWVLEGEKTLVAHGDCADWLVVSARVGGTRREPGGIGLFLVDAQADGVRRRRYKTQDALPAADIELHEVAVPPDAVLGDPQQGYASLARVVESALQCLAAEAVGGMQEMLDTTVDYLKTRRQFGAPIGSFQVLQHRAVDMMIATEQARSMAMYAALMVREPDAGERARAIAAAKVKIGESARFVGQQAIQLHGGIGMTLDCKIGHYFMRASLIEMAFGDTGHHLSALARAGGLVPPTAELGPAPQPIQEEAHG